MLDLVKENLGDPTAVVVIDETGFVKKGSKSVGVAPQYSGTAGKIDNCQIGVFLAYASDKGQVLMDREIYLPKVWTEDQERCREAGVPETVAFATKLVLARRMLERVLAHGLPFAWVTADSVYGADYHLRHFLTEHQIPMLWRSLPISRCIWDNKRAMPSCASMTGWLAAKAGSGGVDFRQAMDQKDRGCLTGRGGRCQPRFLTEGLHGFWSGAASATRQN